MSAANPRGSISDMSEQAHVTLSGDVNGDYLVEESRPDGRLVLVPDWPSKGTSADAIGERSGTKPMAPEEFERHFGHLPTDGEG